MVAGGMGKRLLEMAYAQGAGNRRKVAAEHSHPVRDPALHVAGTPFFFASLSVFSQGDYERDSAWYVGFCLVAYVIAVFALCRMLGYPVAACLAAVAIVAYVRFEPMASEMRVWNVNMIQLAILTGMLYLLKTRRYIGAGVIFGLGATFKPSTGAVLIFLLIVWVLGKRYRKALRFGAGVASGALAGFLVGCLYFGTWDCWLDFLRSLPQITGAGYPVAKGNFSLSRVVLERYDLDVSWYLGAFMIVATGGVYWLARRLAAAKSADKEGNADDSPYEFREDCLVVGLGCAAVLASSPLAWLHYFLLLIPLGICLVRGGAAPPGASWKSVRRGLSALLAAMALLMLYRTPLRKLYVDPADSWAFMMAKLCCRATVILICVGLWMLFEHARAGRPARRRAISS